MRQDVVMLLERMNFYNNSEIQVNDNTYFYNEEKLNILVYENNDHIVELLPKNMLTNCYYWGEIKPELEGIDNYIYISCYNDLVFFL